MRKISVFSFFSGVGMLDLAFEKNGYDIVFVNEYEPDFLQSYIYSREKMNISPPLYGHNTNNMVSYSKLKRRKTLKKLIMAERQKGNLIGFIGGPPCPDFSIGGKNAGAKGENGRLSKTYIDIICKCKPDFFVFENVKGLIKTKKHLKFYSEIKMKLCKNNYLISDSLENALSYGVPQYRERIFLIGLNSNTLNINNNFIDEENKLRLNWDKHRIYELRNVLKHSWPGQTPFIPDGVYQNENKRYAKLTVQFWFDKNQVEKHCNGDDVFKVKGGKNKFETIFEGDTKGKSFKRLHRFRYSPTAAYGHNEVHLHPFKTRRISVAEAMAIQSLPKNFELPPEVSLTKKFKTVGNGVPYLMAVGVARMLYDFLNEALED